MVPKYFELRGHGSRVLRYLIKFPARIVPFHFLFSLLDIGNLRRFFSLQLLLYQFFFTSCNGRHNTNEAPRPYSNDLAEYLGQCLKMNLFASFRSQVLNYRCFNYLYAQSYSVAFGQEGSGSLRVPLNPSQSRFSAVLWP